MGTRVIIENTAGKILFGYNEAKGFWDLPGGSFNDGETLEQNVRREVLEETGISRLHSIETLAHEGDHYLVRARTTEVELTVANDPDREFSKLRFFGVHNIPNNINPLVKPKIYKYYLQQEASGVVEVYVDDEKKYVLDDDSIYETMPRIAQDQTRGKKVRFVRSSISPSAQIRDGLIEEYFDGMSAPRIEFRKMNDCLAKTQLLKDGTVVIVVSDLIFDPAILRRVMAHELIHAYLYNKHRKSYSHDKHNAEFERIAAEINRHEGAGYVTNFANSM